MGTEADTTWIQPRKLWIALPASEAGAPMIEVGCAIPNVA